MKLEKIYSYVFWYNCHVDIWYAVPRDEYANFFSGYMTEGIIESNKINDLIYIIENFESVKKKEAKHSSK